MTNSLGQYGRPRENPFRCTMIVSNTHLATLSKRHIAERTWRFHGSPKNQSCFRQARAFVAARDSDQRHTSRLTMSSRQATSNARDDPSQRDDHKPLWNGAFSRNQTGEPGSVNRDYSWLHTNPKNNLTNHRALSVSMPSSAPSRRTGWGPTTHTGNPLGPAHQ